jgi:hypothetical protein
MINLMDKSDRLLLIKEIEGEENKARKAASLKQFEIFNDRQKQYVIEYLQGQFSEKTVTEMPIIASINLARRVVKQEASLYKESPEREFYNVTPELKELLEEIYDDYGLNDKFMKANEYFKLQGQTHLNWTLKDGKLCARVLLPHHLDVIPYEEDPEKGEIYIISSFDKTNYLTSTDQSPTGYLGTTLQMQDHINQKIGDKDDYKLKKRYVVWSKEFNFVMNGFGDIVSGEEVTNPIGIIPFVDISCSKDFEYWVRQGQSVSDFSVEFNGMISDVANVVRLQGWGQAVFMGPEGLLPESLQIGPNLVLRLPIDPNNPVQTDFKYVTPNADIAGSLDFLKMNLSMFLTSRGIDPKTISMDGTSQSFSSGLERLLSMITKFEASRGDMDLFRKAEMQSFEIIKAFSKSYSGSELLNIPEIPADAYMTIEFEEPEMIKSEKEELDLIQQKLEMGMISELDAYKKINDVDEETAIKELAEINGVTQGANA